MTIRGFIVVNDQSGSPLFPTFDKNERVAQALAVEYLAKLGQGTQTWQQWEGHGYRTMAAKLEVRDSRSAVRKSR